MLGHNDLPVSQGARSEAMNAQFGENTVAQKHYYTDWAFEEGQVKAETLARESTFVAVSNHERVQKTWLFRGNACSRVGCEPAGGLSIDPAQCSTQGTYLFRPYSFPYPAACRGDFFPCLR